MLGSGALEVGRLWQVSAVIWLALFSGRNERGGGAETLSAPPPTTTTQLAPGVGGSWRVEGSSRGGSAKTSPPAWSSLLSGGPRASC